MPHATWKRDRTARRHSRAAARATGRDAARRADRGVPHRRRRGLRADRSMPAQAGPLSQGIVHGDVRHLPAAQLGDRAGGRARRRRPDEGCARTIAGAARRAAILLSRVGAGCARCSVRTTCPYCGVGCGVVARPDGTVARRRRPSRQLRPALLQGRGAGRDARRLPDRLTAPMIDGREASWDEALDLVARAFRRDHRGARAGQRRLLCLRPVPDRGLLRRQQADEGLHRLRPISTPIPGCAWRPRSPAMSAPSARMSCRAATRIWRKPISSCWSAATPPGAIRCCISACSRRAPQRGTRIVVHRSAPHRDGRGRRSASAAGARHRRRCCSTACSSHLADAGALDRGWIARPCAGLRRTRSRRRARTASDLDGVAAADCGVDPEALETFYELFARTERVLTVYSQGVNQSSAGTDKVNAIINCHLATGRIGRPGMGPFSVTGQPNAMGGREVGGLANQLAAHMRFDRAEDLRRAAPLLARAQSRDEARPESRRAVRRGAGRARQGALDRRDQPRGHACPAPIACAKRSRNAPSSSSPIAGRPTRLRSPHVLLPAAAGARRTAPSPTPSGASRASARSGARRASAGRTGGCSPRLARRMGWAEDFAWSSPAAIFREHAALSGVRE